MITQKTIEEVINTAKVEDVVGDFVNLRRRGANLIGLCPFHDEKTPSFSVSPAKNIYKCFGCGEGGNPVQFIIRHENMSFPEAIRYLAQKYKIEVEETENTAEELEKKEITDSLYIVNEFAKDYFSDTLFNREEGRTIGLSYFKERGLLEGTIKKFELGYSTNERDEFTTKAVSKKYNIDHLKTLGLTSQSGYDFFRSRVMFTIHNLSGKVVAFAGRTLSADKKQPKYINSPESEIYIKRNILYGLYHGKSAIRKQDECILVEGYMDVISLHQGGIENVVATSGTSLTFEQVRLLKRFTSNVKLLYDGDAAGIKAALRGLDILLEQDLNVRLVLLPDGHDPDSFLKEKGSADFNHFIEDNAEDFILFKTRILLSETKNDPVQKSIAMRDIMATIAKVSDVIKRSVYIKECSIRLDVSEQILVSEINKIIRANIKSKREQQERTQNTEIKEEEWLTTKPIAVKDEEEFVKNDAWQERTVCSILINYGHQLFDKENDITVSQYIIENIGELLEFFDIDLYKKIITQATESITDDFHPDHQWYINHSDEEIRNFAITVLSSPYTYASWEERQILLQTQKMPEENFVRDATNAIYRLQLKKSKFIVAEIETYLSEASEAEKQTDEYILNLKVYQELLKQRNELTEMLGMVTL